MNELDEILRGGNKKVEPKRIETTESPEGEEDLGPCAALAKNKWITALTIKHASGPWESFQYSGIDVRSTYEPTRFEVCFRNIEAKWHIVVTGRNLSRLYNLVIQARMEWLKAADRDFARDGEVIITGIEVTKIEEE
jgi:hypothetical protein